jgi:hypothetical protein
LRRKARCERGNRNSEKASKEVPAVDHERIIAVHPDSPFIVSVFDLVDQVWLRHYPLVKPKLYQLALPAAPAAANDCEAIAS